MELLTTDQARQAAKMGTQLFAAATRERRGKRCAVLLYRHDDEGEKRFVVFYELRLANESRRREFQSLDAAANTILKGIGLDNFRVMGMTVEQAKKVILENRNAEERR